MKIMKVDQKEEKTLLLKSMDIWRAWVFYLNSLIFCPYNIIK